MKKIVLNFLQKMQYNVLEIRTTKNLTGRIFFWIQSLILKNFFLNPWKWLDWRRRRNCFLLSETLRDRWRMQTSTWTRNSTRRISRDLGLISWCFIRWKFGIILFNCYPTKGKFQFYKFSFIHLFLKLSWYPTKKAH